MKTTYNLIRHKGDLAIYMVSVLGDSPPVMDIGILDMWIVSQHEDYILPFGCSSILVSLKERYKSDIDLQGDSVLDCYEVGTTPKPHWLEEFRGKVEADVERCLLIGQSGEPTIYTHLVPIQDLGDQEYLGMKVEEPFISVDPLADPITYPDYFDYTYGFPKKDRVLVTGCFDLFHAGHAHFLKEVYDNYVEGKDRELHVGLPDDTSYGYLKGRSPIYPFEQRKAILEAIQYVDEVHPFAVWKDLPIGNKYPQNGHRYLLDKVKPVLFVDSRQKPKERIGILSYLRDKKVEIKYVDSINLHTEKILERIRG